MSTLTALKKLSDITAFQWGMFTAAQAERVGVSRIELSRLASNMHTVRLRHGVYRMISSPSDELEELKSIWLSLLPGQFAYERLDGLETDYIVSGRTAAILHEITDYRLDIFEFSHKGRRQSRNIHVKFKNAQISPTDIVILNGLPVTSKTRTIYDLKKAHEE